MKKHNINEILHKDYIYRKIKFRNEKILEEKNQYNSHIVY